MKRIAILGCENSHANAFLTFIKEKDEFGDIEVVGVYSDDLTAAEKLHTAFGVSFSVTKTIFTTRPVWRKQA